MFHKIQRKQIKTTTNEMYLAKKWLFLSDETCKHISKSQNLTQIRAPKSTALITECNNTKRSGFGKRERENQK